jgi:hypothetical protein
VEVSGRKAYAALKADSSTDVIVYKIGLHHRRTIPCTVCGIAIDVYDSTEAMRKYCSRTCIEAERAAKMHRECVQCGKVFRAEKTARKFCSLECTYKFKRADVDCSECGTTFSKQKCHIRETNYCSGACNKMAVRRKMKADGWRAGDCQQCGGPVTRKEYKRCNPCRMGGVSGRPKKAESK